MSDSALPRSTPELEPQLCPWCGSEPRVTNVEIELPSRDGWGVLCIDGGCATNPATYAATKEDAIEHWNARRVSPAGTPPTPNANLIGALDICAMYLDQCERMGIPEDAPVIADSFSNAELRLMLNALARASGAGTPAPAPTTDYRVGEEDDEIVFGDFHMERMSDKHIWFSVGGVSFDLHAISVKGRVKLVWHTQVPAGWSGIAAEFAQQGASPAPAPSREKP